MQWDSLADLLALSGYGFYVWSAFGVTALCMMCEVLGLWWRRGAADEGMPRHRLMKHVESP